MIKNNILPLKTNETMRLVLLIYQVGLTFY